MKTSKLTTIVLLGMVVVAVTSFYVGRSAQQHADELAITGPAPLAQANKLRPSFSLPDLEGRLRQVSEWDGKVLVVNFWATWCPPCRKEIPVFIALQEKYAAQGLQFIGIALDEKDKVQDFVDTMGIEYPILVGGKQAERVSVAYGNRFGALPYTVIIDKNKNIISQHRGELTQTQVEQQIKHLL